MEVVSSILGSLVAESARVFCGSIYSNIRNTFKSQLNLNALEREMRNLIDRMNDINEELKKARKEGEIPIREVTKWLREVEGIELEVNSMQADTTGNGGNFCGYCLNCALHYRRSQKVIEKRKEVERLLKVGTFPAGMTTVDNQVETVEYIPGPLIESSTIASEKLARIMDLLNNDEVRSIGVWGMGGVGKTTLVKNLNNKLKNDPEQPFSVVIWIIVSQELDLKKIQRQIADRLKMEVKLEETVESVAIKLHERLKSEEKFLLILDGVWDKIDLDSVGVPQPEIHKGSKIILTSRSLDVCRRMKTDEQVKLKVLSDEEAWQLFTKNAGEVASLEDIKPVAEAVARECNGLPLAIIIVGAAMRGKAILELWKDALNELRRSEPDYIKGIKKDVYKPLKWSYDSLQGKNIKPCFLYCSLFPEDFSIEVSELVQCWMAEGLIDEQLNSEDSFNKGIAIIENLKDSCLLEHGTRKDTVKMHDVVRDVAIWIASFTEDRCKSLVQSGIGLSQISEVELVKSWDRISFMNNKITTLPDCVIQCSNTSTLLLQGNQPLEKVPESFLLGFQALKVLNMSGTSIKSLPLSLTQLGELRALVLRQCNIKELTPLEGLKKLQVLNLSGTPIKELPEVMKELSNLRQLDLSFTSYLVSIRAGIVSRWSGLEVLDMRQSAFQWGVKGEVGKGWATVEELGCLKQLIVVHISLVRMPYLDIEDLIWIERLRSFKISVGQKLDSSAKRNERKVIISYMDLSEKHIEWLLINVRNLVLIGCKQIGWMLEYLVLNSKGFSGLKSLTIKECDSLGPFRGCATQHDLLPHLEELYLNRINNLECVLPLDAPLGLRFSRLRVINVSSCRKLIYLIPYDLIPYLINVEQIKVFGCRNLEKLFEYTSRSRRNVVPDPVLPKLRILELIGNHGLRSICREKESWHSLEKLKVINCNQLMRLPLTTQNVDTIKEIRGEEQGWSRLEWDDDHTKSTLLPFFNPIDTDKSNG